MSGFGERLRKLRRDSDVTQAQLANYLGVVSSAVGKYEKQPRSYPSVEVLLKISDYFHVSTDYLLKGNKTVSEVENNINGNMSNSSFIQANHNGIVINGDNEQTLSLEALELLNIYETLGGRDRLKLLNYAVELEGSTK